MKRRRLLAGGGATLFGGCLGRVTFDVGGSESSETFGPDEIQRRMSLVKVDNVPEEHDVRIGVELLNGTVTAADAAHLRVTVTNEGGKRKLTAGEGGCNLFNRGKGKSEKPGLWLHESENTKWIERRGNRWTRNRDSNKKRAYPAYGCSYRLYESGESVTNDYLIWDDYRVEGYMTPGTYRFEEGVRVYAPEYDDWKDTLGEFRCAFDLRVRDG